MRAGAPSRSAARTVAHLRRRASVAAAEGARTGQSARCETVARTVARCRQRRSSAAPARETRYREAGRAPDAGCRQRASRRRHLARGPYSAYRPRRAVATRAPRLRPHRPAIRRRGPCRSHLRGQPTSKSWSWSSRTRAARPPSRGSWAWAAEGRTGCGTGGMPKNLLWEMRPRSEATWPGCG